MNTIARVATGRSSPGLRYRNVGAAIDWLSRAYGFEVRSVETDETGAVIYAELSFGTTMIMVGAVNGFDLDRYMAQPDDIGGAETQCAYYVVDDIDALYTRSRREGCRIVIDLQTRPNGARVFTCRDPEGHLWCFGTYDPWENVPLETGAFERAMDMQALAAPADAASYTPGYMHSLPFPGRLAAGLSMAAIVSGMVAAWVYAEAWQSSRQAGAAPATLIGPERMIGAQIANEEFQSAIRDARRRLAVERRLRIAAQRASEAARAAAAKERSLRITAEQTAKQLTEEIEEARRAADLAEDAAKTAAADLAKVRAAMPKEQARLTREAVEAQKAADAAQAQLAHTEQALAAAKAGLAKERAAKPKEHARLTREAKKAQQAARDAQRQLARAEKARAAAEAETKATRARLTFVSHHARVGSEQAIVEIRKQMTGEKELRQAAEREAQEARDELARERDLKLAALQTVEQLKERLAAVDDDNSAPRRKRRTVYVKKRAAVARKPSPVTTPPKTNAGTEKWSLYSGPHFAKDFGAQ